MEIGMEETKKEGAMKKILLVMAAMMMTSGCAELKVIGKAAVREMTSEAINVEQASYDLPQRLAEEKKVQVAQAAQAAKQPERKKGLWERQ